MYLADIYTVTADLAGIPGISVPCGETKEKLPIGLQILANILMKRQFCEWRTRMSRRPRLVCSSIHRRTSGKALFLWCELLVGS